MSPVVNEQVLKDMEENMSSFKMKSTVEHDSPLLDEWFEKVEGIMREQLKEIYRLARIGMWVEKHRPAITESLAFVEYEYNTGPARDALAAMPNGEGK